ncbi:hypothetical protein [Thermomonospora umbrina]|uniref:hypothetical protein n=1 Tax=Thermomonospora umbrina TaxID=111806 RepID=UPI000E26D4DA|nr:hypothetical protein [Thermomonospora umbrina]
MTAYSAPDKNAVRWDKTWYYVHSGQILSKTWTLSYPCYDFVGLLESGGKVYKTPRANRC